MSELDDAERAFVAAWPDALTAFSPYTRLLPPIYCRTKKEEEKEGLSESFAMIRIRDERIVIGLREIVDKGLVPHARAILAHEVGHYVHAPGSLGEHARLHARIQRTLPAVHAGHAGLVANLYTDLLLNDRLQREGSADVAAVYRALWRNDAGPLFQLYMRIYERLWSLPAGTLVRAVSGAIDVDADLGARLIRVFRDRWMEGAASFAVLIAPYLEGVEKGKGAAPPWLDTTGASIGDQIPDGLLEDDFDPAEVQHPAHDARIHGMEGEGEGGKASTGAAGRALRGDGRRDARTVKRGPKEWLDVLRGLRVERDPKELVSRYYRELAMRHIVPFPSRQLQRAGDPLPEGLDPWEVGAPIEQIDWFQSLVRSPVVIPGVSLVERAFGVAEGGEPEKRAPDLYVGIDCSGSMGNPAVAVSYPVVAGAVLTLSALRAGARVMCCLSGQWAGAGEHTETRGFVRDERALLGVLTDYLGTGASFGLDRLAVTFALQPPQRRPAHVLVVSDSDFFGEIEQTKDGWEILRRSIERAGAGGTAVLRLVSESHYRDPLEKLRKAGMEPYLVATEEELVTFARAFARRTFGDVKEAAA